MQGRLWVAFVAGTYGNNTEAFYNWTFISWGQLQWLLNSSGLLLYQEARDSVARMSRQECDEESACARLCSGDTGDREHGREGTALGCGVGQATELLSTECRCKSGGHHEPSGGGRCFQYHKRHGASQTSAHFVRQGWIHPGAHFSHGWKPCSLPISLLNPHGGQSIEGPTT